MEENEKKQLLVWLRKQERKSSLHSSNNQDSHDCVDLQKLNLTPELIQLIKNTGAAEAYNRVIHCVETDHHIKVMNFKHRSVKR